jgi:hypothetical protein
MILYYILGGEMGRLSLAGNIFFANTTVADAGDAGALPATGGTVNMTSAAAETRTLANPASLGIKLILVMDVDLGDIVITSASGVNVAGNTILTFDTAGESAVLESAQVGGSLVWRITHNDGVALA